MAKYTVVGGQGFIGAEVVKQLEEQSHNVFIPKKNDSRLFTDDLGVLIYCAGHGDCNNNPFKVFHSNSVLLSEILENAAFNKLVYVSSTRLYMGQECASERDDLTVLTSDSRRLFNLTKLLSEELCLLSNKNVIVIRPSNVYGLALNSPLFLPAITRNAINNSQVDMYVTPDYKKDYVSVIDVAYAICELSGKSDLSHRVFNVASGVNTSAGDIADLLNKETGCDINWHKGSVDEIFPKNDISALQNEIVFNPKNVLDDLRIMVDKFKKAL